MDRIDKYFLGDIALKIELYSHDEALTPETQALIEKLTQFIKADDFDQEQARQVLTQLYERYGDVIEANQEMDHHEDDRNLARWRELSERMTRDRAVAMVRRLRTEFYQWKLENASLSMDPDDCGKISIGLKIEHDGKQCKLWCSGLEIQLPEEVQS